MAGFVILIWSRSCWEEGRKNANSMTRSSSSSSSSLSCSCKMDDAMCTSFRRRSCCCKPQGLAKCRWWWWWRWRFLIQGEEYPARAPLTEHATAIMRRRSLAAIILCRQECLDVVEAIEPTIVALVEKSENATGDTDTHNAEPNKIIWPRRQTPILFRWRTRQEVIVLIGWSIPRFPRGMRWCKMRTPRHVPGRGVRFFPGWSLSNPVWYMFVVLQSQSTPVGVFC